MYCTSGEPFPGDASKPRDLPPELLQEPEAWRSGWEGRISPTRVGQWTRSAEMRQLSTLVAGLLRIASFERTCLHAILQGLSPYSERYAALCDMEDAFSADIVRVASVAQAEQQQPEVEVGGGSDDGFAAWCLTPAGIAAGIAD